MSAMRVSLFLLLITSSLFSNEEMAKEELPVLIPEDANVAKLDGLFKKSPPAPEGYTINYNTVSIIEYIRFASKICKTNFIYEEADLNFTVTVVSDEPATQANVMATLIQVLRVHGLMLLEQGNNLVIHKSPDVRQVATLVTEGSPEGNSAIVTRIFRVKNAKPQSVAAIIQPMISTTALIETSVETRQIIVTDIKGNVDKIAALIENLDSPHTLLEIQSFPTEHNSPEFLIELASQIMSPIAQGNPFILVPQPLASEIFIVSTPDLVEKTLAVFKNLDTVPKVDLSKMKRIKAENIFVYKVMNRSGEEVLKGLVNIGSTLQDSAVADPDLVQMIDSAKWIPETNSIMLIGNTSSLAKGKEFLAALDVPGDGRDSYMGKTSFFVYKPQYRSAEEISNSIIEMAQNLKGSKGADPHLIETIESVKINPLTHTLSFSGEEKYFDQIRKLLGTIDSSGGKASAIPPSTQFFIYKPVNETGEELVANLKEVMAQLKSDKLADPAFMNALSTMKWVKSTNSILFTGDPSSLEKVQKLIASFDSQDARAYQKTFYQYHPQSASVEKTENYLKQIASNLQKKGGSSTLIETLTSYKWIPDSQTFMFYGNPGDLNQVKDLLTTFDNQKHASTFLQYHPKYAGEQKTRSYVNEVADNMAKKGGSQSLIEALRSFKWIPDSHTVMFYGNDQDLAQIKDLLTAFDTPDASTKQSYYLYRVQNTTGDVIEEDLDNLAKNFKSSGLKDVKILDVIGKIRYVKQTNSLLLSGDPQAIEEVKQIIAGYDFPRSSQAMSHSNFYMYKPQNLQAHQVEKSLKEVGSNLKSAGLADPNLLKSIDSVKYVDATNSLIFTGSPETLTKVQGLIKEIDIAPTSHAPIQHVGKTTFLLYKLKNASGPQIISSIKNVSAELKKNGSSDKEFVAALNSMKYVKETNSLFFTGTEESLGKVQTLVEKFDVSSLGGGASSANGPTNFFVYKTQSLSGPELEKLLGDFTEHLASSGLNDPDLFSTIRSVRWTEATQTLVFTGTEKSLNQVKELLKEFDIPSNLPNGPGIANPSEPSIQAIDNTSFLVYKLQFHKGDEIQGALRQIAKDLIISNAPVNQGLLNSINSIQWLEVTNSLLCSGDQETLTRLRELIKNLDIPLKQVFIEMLMIETNLANALQFGLEWGANYKYRDKFSGNTFNTPPNLDPNATPDQFVTNLAGLNSTVTPVPSKIPPPNSGFDLGVIGEVIRHKGDTFLTLGSLLSALQTDSETSIIMTPKIITQDGRTSTLFRGENIPFAGSFVSNTSGGGTINTSNIEYRDIGVSLTVTPVLGNSDIVTLDISLDRSQTVGDITQATLQPGAQTASGIITSKTTMQTTVHVPDNSFLVLTGMVNNSNVKAKSGIPCLGGLPGVGALFSKSSDSVTNSNIVIFIRPHIINSVDDMRKISTKEEDFFRDQVGTPFLERNFDEGMELIKTVDDE